jgi:single-strand DNA-binding protein
VHGGGLAAAPALDGQAHEHESDHGRVPDHEDEDGDEDEAGSDHRLDDADPVGPSERMLEQDGAAFDPDAPDHDAPLDRVAA